MHRASRRCCTGAGRDPSPGWTATLRGDGRPHPGDGVTESFADPGLCRPFQIAGDALRAGTPYVGVPSPLRMRAPVRLRLNCEQLTHAVDQLAQRGLTTAAHV